MTAMTCRLGGLFSLDEDFDDEDVLGTDWSAGSTSKAASVVATEQEESRGSPPPACDGTISSTLRTAAQNPALGLRQIPSTSRVLRPPLVSPNNSQQDLASQNHTNPKSFQRSSPDLEDFDDWDVDFADLDEFDRSTKPPPPPPPPAEPSSSTKTLRPSALRSNAPPDRTFGEHRTSGLPGSTAAPRSLPAPSHPPQTPAVLRSLTGPSHPPQTPAVLRSLAGPSHPPQTPGTSPASSSFSRILPNPQQTHKPWTTPRASPQARGLFETVSPSVPASPHSPHPLHTPILTNRLVQLVSASSKLPKKRPRSESRQPRTRRFPGPAGLLPQQPQGQNLDQIVVSVPQTPAHGAAARPPSQASCSQTEEEEFSAGGWAAMKAEMGLDERNPSCFLHSYSVVMVLRKAALKQLARNKVPNMAVLLKSIIHTNADAKAVFRDPTGEMQGTVHRRLLEERAEELKVGAVLLLKQVGVFSPSHRNHYLNVTPNNLLRIYAPDGVAASSTRLPPLDLESPPTRTPSVRREALSQMQLVFDEEDDEGERGAGGSAGPPAKSHTEIKTSFSSGGAPQEHAGNAVLQDGGWDADDDLDELLGALPEDACSL
uniref:Homologous recombination factor with OB-fold n=1 Tax=Oryzias melastigma TaxID=30732 RepID=A0A3B3CN70_ORYME